MAQHNRIQVIQAMTETGLVPLFYHHDTDLCKEVLKACHKGGARVLEFTNRGDLAHEVYRELAEFTLSELPGLILGVGSVQDAGTASLYMQLGANFVVSPFLKEDIAIVCNRRKVMWSPGCGSLNEISRAEELGAEIIKIFPGGTLGPGFVKAVRGPCPWTTIMPTGGVSPDEENLRSWFEAGVVCVGMGSKLIRKDFLANKDFKAIEDTVRETLKTIKEIRSNL